MTVLGGWVLVPLLLVALVTGLGLLAERAAGTRLPGALVPPLGLAALIALTGIPTLWDATSELSIPLASGLAALGFALARPWSDARLRAAWPWPALAALGTFAVFAAPSLLSGQASITGWVKLDDSAIWLAITDQVITHARDVSDLPPSSYQLTLQSWLGSDYPVGAFLPLGVASALGGQDPAGAYQGVIAMYAVLLALGLLVLARSLLSPRAGAAAAVVGVQASLFLGYTQWGGIKEAALAALIPVLAALAVRGELALTCVAAGAVTGVMGVNGAAWAAPALLLALVQARPQLRQLAATVPVLVLATLPALTTIDFVRNTTQGALSSEDELGNLVEPPDLIQGLGLWPVGDFRFQPDPRVLAILLALACTLGAGFAIWVAARRGAWQVPALLGITLAGVVPALVVGSPWVDAKALAVLSPMVLLAATAALGGAPRALRAGGFAVLVAGCAWSTLAVLRDVYVAPRERLAELETAGGIVGGLGPLVQLDFDIYGNRYFLRGAAPEGATDLRRRQVRKLDGSLFTERTTAEVDQMATADLWVYRTIVRRRSPVASRPPTAFRRIHAGDAWEVWTRDPQARAPLARLPLGDDLQPTAIPDCARVRALAQTPGIRTLAAVPRRAPYVAPLQGDGIPAAWRAADGTRPAADGSATVPFSVPEEGNWRMWVGGSVLGTLDVSVDGIAAGSAAHEIAHTGQWLRFGAPRIGPGNHELELAYTRGGFLRAGRGAASAQPPLGPVAVTAPEDDGELPVIEVPPRRARTLCDGRTYDWIEALG